jgi:LacI family transcriptional regulator
MIAKQRPVVLLNRVIPEVGCVVGDDLAGARSAVEHLAGLGHRSLCYLAGPEAGWADGVRWRGLQQAAVERGLTVRRLGPHDPTTAEGARAAARVAAGRATAVVAYDEALAVGLVTGLTRLGVDVPGEISVLGFDGTAMGAMVVPALSTIIAPLAGIGAGGVRLCLELAAGSRTDLPVVVLPVGLVVRASTAPPPRTVGTPRRARARSHGPARSTDDGPGVGRQLPATVRYEGATLRG